MAPNPRLCRLLRAVRPVLRPPRQFREPGVVGRADDRPLGGPLRRDHPLRQRSSARRVTRASSTKRSSRASCCSGSSRGCSGKRKARYEPGKLVGAFIFFYGLFRFGIEFIREPDSQLVRLRAGDAPAHGSVAVAADDPRRPVADADREGAARPRRADGGHRFASRDSARTRASRPHPRPRGRSPSKRSWKPATPIITRRATRSARAATSRLRRRSARCSARWSVRLPRRCAGSVPGRQPERSTPSSARDAARLLPTRFACCARQLCRRGPSGRNQPCPAAGSGQCRCRCALARIDRRACRTAADAGRERIPRCACRCGSMSMGSSAAS